MDETPRTCREKTTQSQQSTRRIEDKESILVLVILFQLDINTDTMLLS